jgi:hypothetical protein
MSQEEDVMNIPEEEPYEVIDVESESVVEVDDYVVEDLPVEEKKKSSTPLIIALVILIVMCCCCATISLIWGAWAFGDQFVGLSSVSLLLAI